MCLHAYTVYTHTMEYYSAMKENEIMSFAVTWMDLEIIILCEAEKDKNHIVLICGINFKKQMNLFIKLTEIENKLKVNKRERRRRDKLEA